MARTRVTTTITVSFHPGTVALALVLVAAMNAAGQQVPGQHVTFPFALPAHASISTAWIGLGGSAFEDADHCAEIPLTSGASHATVPPVAFLNPVDGGDFPGQAVDGGPLSQACAILLEVLFGDTPTGVSYVGFGDVHVDLDTHVPTTLVIDDALALVGPSATLRLCLMSQEEPLTPVSCEDADLLGAEDDVFLHVWAFSPDHAETGLYVSCVSALVVDAANAIVGFIEDYDAFWLDHNVPEHATQWVDPANTPGQNGEDDCSDVGIDV